MRVDNFGLALLCQYRDLDVPNGLVAHGKLLFHVFNQRTSETRDGPDGNQSAH